MVVPVLVNLSFHLPDNSNVVLCKSERYKWLLNLSNDTKPDFFVKSAFFVKLTMDHRYGGGQDDRVFATPADKCFLPKVQFLW